MQTYILVAVIGYLIGSIPFSYIVGKMTTHLDLRQHGSGNIGATNVIRVAGRKAGVLAFLLDLLKGILSYWIGTMLLGIVGAALACGFAIIGHSYSVFMRFKGGKGVATTYGVILAFNQPMAVLLFVLQFIVVKWTHYMSLGSIVAAILVPILGWLFGMPSAFILLGLFIAAFVPYRHSANIRRLFDGTENRFDI